MKVRINWSAGGFKKKNRHSLCFSSLRTKLFFPIQFYTLNLTLLQPEELPSVIPTWTIMAYVHLCTQVLPLDSQTLTHTPTDRVFIHLWTQGFARFCQQPEGRVHLLGLLRQRIPFLRRRRSLEFFLSECSLTSGREIRLLESKQDLCRSFAMGVTKGGQDTPWLLVACT